MIIYRIYDRSNHELLDTLEMHVLARAYRDAWRSVHTCDPVGIHVIGGLDVLIVFGAWPP